MNKHEFKQGVTLPRGLCGASHAHGGLCLMPASDDIHTLRSLDKHEFDPIGSDPPVCGHYCDVTGLRCFLLASDDIHMPGVGSVTLVTAMRKPTTYIDTNVYQVMDWQDAGLCPWCGNNCKSDECFARKCDCCTQVWLADTPADVADGHILTEEDCPECKVWMATMHLDNPAASFKEGDL